MKAAIRQPPITDKYPRHGGNSLRGTTVQVGPGPLANLNIRKACRSHYDQNGYSERLFSGIKHGPRRSCCCIFSRRQAIFLRLTIPTKPGRPIPKSLTPGRIGRMEKLNTLSTANAKSAKSDPGVVYCYEHGRCLFLKNQKTLKSEDHSSNPLKESQVRP